MNEVALTMMAFGFVVFIAHAFSEVFQRTRVPDLLVLLLIGLFLGPIFNVINVESMRSMGSVFTTVALVIILFEGGSELSINNIKSCAKDLSYLTLTSFIITMLGTALFAHFVLGFKLMLSVFFGAVLGSSSTAITIPLTRQLNLSDKGRATMVLEASFATVVSFIVSLAIFEAFTEGTENAGSENNFPFFQILGNIVSSFVLSALISFFAAIIWSTYLDKIRTLRNSTFTTPALVFVVYGINSLLGFSGEIAALTFGITLANVDRLSEKVFLQRFFKRREPHMLNDNEKMLFSEVAFLLRTFVFVYIGASIHLNDIVSIVYGFGITCLLIVFRIISVRVSIVRKKNKLSDLDFMFISTQVPKGLAAAMLATVLITKPIPLAEEARNIIFSVIFFSIIITCLFVPIIEKFEFTKKLLRKILFFGYKKTEDEKN